MNANTSRLGPGGRLGPAPATLSKADQVTWYWSTAIQTAQLLPDLALELALRAGLGANHLSLNLRKSVSWELLGWAIEQQRD